MTVALVGAGPGDPGLIAARGLELVRRCDVLVHDRLVAAELVAEAPPTRSSSPWTGSARPSSTRAARCVRPRVRARRPAERRRPVRLRLRRGGSAVARAKPESSSRSCRVCRRSTPCPRAGIPLTHRGVATDVRVLTGRIATEEPLAPTIVVFMGITAVAEPNFVAVARPLPAPDSGATLADAFAALDPNSVPNARRGITQYPMFVVGAARKALVG